MSGVFNIRRMSLKEVHDIAVNWAAKEGWNPGLHDAACFFSVDPQGFFVGELDGKPIASISAVAYNDKFGFLGFYIVKPEFRAHGYGIQVWHKALEYMGTRNIGGDGVLERIKDYETQGFKSYYKNRRYQGFGSGHPASQGLSEILKTDFGRLAAYDDSIFPAQRHSFLKCWIAQPGTRGYTAIENCKLSGYGVVRPCFKGYKIGPLFADNSRTAEKIFTALRGDVPKNQEIFFDAPELNPDALQLAEKYGMKIVFETARIYSKRAPHIPIQKVFGVTSFELG